MTQMTINSNEIEQFVLRKFGNNNFTAISTGDIVLLINHTNKYLDSQKKNNAVDKLYGMFKDTSLLSSDDFARNKKFEKEIEEKKFNL